MFSVGVALNRESVPPKVAVAMSYQCKDCTYSQKGRFPAGGCPACGSFNVQRDHTDVLPRSDADGPKTWRLWVSIALWLALAILLYLKAVDA